jgi:hypothetical protein
MNTNIQQIQIFSENREYPNELIIDIDGTKPTCPITFYSAGIPVFSLASYEVDQFCEELQKLVP